MCDVRVNFGLPISLSVLDLGPMYATDRRQTSDRQTDRRQTSSSLTNPLHIRGWGIISAIVRQLREDLSFSIFLDFYGAE